MWNFLRWRVVVLAALLLVAACGGRATLVGGDDGHGGAPGAGGSILDGGGGSTGRDGGPNGRGGSPGRGGGAGTMGVAGNPGFGGMPAAGGSGMLGAGGMVGLGGFPAAGGMPGIGGVPAAGGMPAAGGTAGVDFGTLNGRVVDADTGDPLANVSVSFVTPNGMMVSTTYTASDGTYSFSLPSGTVFAYFQLEGYLPTSGTFEVVANEASEVNVTRLVPIGDGVSGSLTGRVLNAETTDPIAGASVLVRAGVNATQGSVVARTTSNDDGSYVFDELPAGTYTIEGNADGFTQSFVAATVIADDSSDAPDLLLSRVLDGGQFRIVLTWGEHPTDLDAHLHVPPIDVSGFEDGFEVFYSQRGNLAGVPFAELDVDDTESFGPETISISQAIPGTYHYLVHRFSQDASFSVSEAQVSIFDESGLVYTAFVPTTGSGDYWHVFDIDGETLTITAVNERLSSDPFD